MNANTVDGVSPELRYAAYGVYALGGTVIVGAARGVMTLAYIIKNYVCAKLAEHYKSAGKDVDGYEEPKVYYARIKKWAKTEGLRSLMEISWIGGLCLTAKEATNYSKGNTFRSSKGVYTWGHGNTEQLLAREGFYEFWGSEPPEHTKTLGKKVRSVFDLDLGW